MFAKDDIFGKLRVWVDADGNAKSGEGELKTLAANRRLRRWWKGLRRTPNRAEHSLSGKADQTHKYVPERSVIYLCA